MKFSFQRSGVIILLLAASFITAGCVARPQAAPFTLSPLAAAPADRNIVVAKVNETNITRYALIEMMNRLSAANPGKNISEPRAATRKRALDLLVLQELAFQAATRQHLGLGAGVLDKAMEKLRADAGGEEGYRKFLEKEQMTDAGFRARVERNLLIQQILAAEMVTKIVISEDDLQKEYERTKDRLRDPEKITVTDVTFFLKLDDPASMEQANAVLTRIQADKDKDPGNLVSDGTFLVQNYELEKNREPVLYDAVRKLDVGGLSGVIKTRDSIHIVKLTNYLPEKPKPYKEVRSVIEGRLKAALQKTRRREWEQELKQGARIEIMDAREPVQ
jgi:hypothetical protein